MAKSPKPVALMTKNLTKEEKEIRLEQEAKLKGNSDKVYRPPKGTNKEVAKIYKTIVTELKEANILNNLDIELIMNTAYAIYRMREARQKLDEDGPIITTFKIVENNGQVEKIPTGLTKHPAVTVEKEYQAIFHTGCLQLGLSPSSRAKLTLINMDSNKEESLEDKVFGS